MLNPLTSGFWRLTSRATFGHVTPAFCLPPSPTSIILHQNASFAFFDLMHFGVSEVMPTRYGGLDRSNILT
jgi:hypothetical protein